MVVVAIIGCLSIGPACASSQSTLMAAGLDIEWVTVGDPGNPSDATTGRGSVADVFQISKHEVTRGQYAAFLSAVAATDPRGLWHGGLGIERTSADGKLSYAVKAPHDRLPVSNVTFVDAMRFANWLHHTQPGAPADAEPAPAVITETGAYDMAAGGGLAPRSPKARAWIPDENEWYKAAYHQPQAAGGPAGHYWRYPTRSDTQPTPRKAGAPGPNDATFMSHESDYHAPLPVGSFPNATSHHGTLDQGGNVWEWVETTVFDTKRMLRGGSALGSHEHMLAPSRSSASPTRRYNDTGFRIARRAPPAPKP